MIYAIAIIAFIIWTILCLRFGYVEGYTQANMANSAQRWLEWKERNPDD